MRRRAVLLLTLMATTLMMAASPAWADNFIVTSTSDIKDHNTDDGECDAFATFLDACTLRAAIEQANANGEADKITFASALSGTITLSLGALQIADRRSPQGR